MLAERRPQAGLAHPPEIDLYPIDQRNRDLVPVILHVLGRGGHGDRQRLVTTRLQRDRERLAQNRCPGVRRL